MAKKIKCVVRTFGIYERFDKGDKELPRFLEGTTKIPCRLDIEFGYVLHITGGKGKKLTFEIDHPPFKDSSGETAPAFVGDVYINSNDYRFFLGDTIWLPLEDKLGPWTLTTYCSGKKLAQKTLKVVTEKEYARQDNGNI